MCFTNWTDDLNEGSIVELNNCELELYETKSYEIYTDCFVNVFESDDFSDI